jgi:hypothetical protein
VGSLYRKRLTSGNTGAVWWIKYYVTGRPIRESTGTMKKSEAAR